jgi:hypothetical protein
MKNIFPFIRTYNFVSLSIAGSPMITSIYQLLSVFLGLCSLSGPIEDARPAIIIVTLLP